MTDLLDPLEARPNDRKWWLKVRWALDWLENANRNEIRRLKHDLNCALIDYMAGDKVVNLHWDQAMAIQASIHQTLIPWEPADTGKLGDKRLRNLIGMWEHKWGAMKDPETQKSIQRTVDHLNKMAEVR